MFITPACENLLYCDVLFFLTYFELVFQGLMLSLIVCFRFLAENKSKKQAADKENGREKEQSAADRELDKGNKSGDLYGIESKEDKTVPFFDAGEEEFLKSHRLKDSDIEEDGEIKSTLTARDIFGKWDDEPSYSTSYPSVKEKSRRDAEDAEAIDHMEEDLYRSRKHSSKKEEKAKKKEKKEKEKFRRSLSPPSTSREKDRPLFPGAFPPHEEPSAPRLSSSREDFELKIGSLDEISRYASSQNKFLKLLCYRKTEFSSKDIGKCF